MEKTILLFVLFIAFATAKTQEAHIVITKIFNLMNEKEDSYKDLQSSISRLRPYAESRNTGKMRTYSSYIVDEAKNCKSFFFKANKLSKELENIYVSEGKAELRKQAKQLRGYFFIMKTSAETVESLASKIVKKPSNYNSSTVNNLVKINNSIVSPYNKAHKLVLILFEQAEYDAMLYELDQINRKQKVKDSITLIKVIAMMDGTYSEPYKEYFDNGQVMIAGQKDSNGRRTGQWKYFYIKGRLSSIGSFKEGKRIGEWKNIFKNGQTSAIGKYKDGEKIGEWKFYYSEGPIKEIKQYDKGQLRKVEEYDINGNLKKETKQ